MTLLVSGWLIYFYRKFASKPGEPLWRVLLKASVSAFVYGIAATQLIADTTFRLPLPFIYPLVWLSWPIVSNLLHLIRNTAWRTRNNSDET